MISSHDTNGKLRGRLKEHFQINNKDRSIFRKTIGRSILNIRKEPYLKIWDLDITSKKNKEKHGYLLD